MKFVQKKPLYLRYSRDAFLTMFLFWYIHEVFVFDLMQAYVVDVKEIKNRIVAYALTLGLVFMSGGCGFLLVSCLKLAAKLKSFAADENYLILVDQLVFSIEVIIGLALCITVMWLGF